MLITKVPNNLENKYLGQNHATNYNRKRIFLKNMYKSTIYTYQKNIVWFMYLFILLKRSDEYIKIEKNNSTMLMIGSLSVIIIIVIIP
jgi:hypothetical protein